MGVLKKWKARKLLKGGKAKVEQRTPFTIQLFYDSSGYKQPATLGVKSGYTYIVLSAVTSRWEVYSSEVKLRDNIVKLNSDLVFLNVFDHKKV